MRQEGEERQARPLKGRGSRHNMAAAYISRALPQGYTPEACLHNIIKTTDPRLLEGLKNKNNKKGTDSCMILEKYP